MCKLPVSVLLLGLAGSAAAEPVYFPTTGHWYEYRADALAWSDAVYQAWSSGYVDPEGHAWIGYLATVTSVEEDAFLADGFGGRGWLGGGDGDVDGAWAWETGPEVGAIFWDDGPTSLYANWAPGEPAADPAEKCLLKRAPEDGGDWEAESATSLHPFFVEYEMLSTPAPEGIDLRSWGTVKDRFRRPSGR